MGDRVLVDRREVINNIKAMERYLIAIKKWGVVGWVSVGFLVHLSKTRNLSTENMQPTL